MNSSSDGLDSPQLDTKARNVIAVFLIAFGLFGNVSFVVAVRTKKEIRNKHGILLSIMCTAQTICLIFEFLKRSNIAIADKTTRDSCFKAVFVYIITATYQSEGILMVGVDILVSLIVPVRYYNLRNFPYLLYLQVPCVIVSAIFPIYNLSLDMPDYAISDCNPVFMLWSWVNIVICFLVVVLYAAMVFIVLVSVIAERRKSTAMCAEGICTKYSPNSQYQRRTVTSMLVFMGVFSFSWFLSNGATHISYLVRDLESTTLYTIYAYSLLPSLICYSQSYYVHFAMSKDYRKAFLSSGIFACIQLGKKTCEQRSAATVSTSFESSMRNT